MYRMRAVDLVLECLDRESTAFGEMVCVGAGGAVVDMGVGKDAGVGVGMDVSVDASVGMELWMR